MKKKIEDKVEIDRTVREVTSWSSNVNHSCFSILEAVADIERRMGTTEWGPQHEYRRKVVAEKLENVKLAAKKLSYSLNMLDDELREIK